MSFSLATLSLFLLSLSFSFSFAFSFSFSNITLVARPNPLACTLAKLHRACAFLMHCSTDTPPRADRIPCDARMDSCQQPILPIRSEDFLVVFGTLPL